MKHFIPVYLNPTDEWPDHLQCPYCLERVERGIVSVSTHWNNCIKNPIGLVIVNSDEAKKIMDSLSMNVDETGKKTF